MASPSRKKTKSPTKVEALKHDDSRKNIPTVELRDFAAPHEKNPPVKKYPRDESLDPQLVWKGKDEQDSQDLSVVTVPIYIQEKIEPKAIIEDLRRDSAGREDELRLFADFNGIEPQHVLDFYNHGVNWSNRMILGDSLLVMSSLAEKENLKGQVQMIYIDPPYGIKFGSNWQVSTRKRDVRDGKDTDLVRQPEQIRAFRDTWERGVHSYLSYLRDRLMVARELLTESGSVFVQIGDENVHLVRSLLDEVFGSENFVSLIIARKTTSESASYLGSTVDFVLWYAKKWEQTRYRKLFIDRSSDAASRYDQVMLLDGSVRPARSEERTDPSLLPIGARLFQADNMTSSRPAQEGDLRELDIEGEMFTPRAGTFKTNAIGMQTLLWAQRLQSTTGGTLRYRRFLDDFPVARIGNLWNDISGAVQSRSDPKVYVVQTSTALVERCLLMTTDPGDLVLDPTCGSGTTAYVAEQWGRRWITIDT
ncbi:MAG: site-specific DNA-methyltransferase, partial [Acidimicrobiia bacterium]|nr:site-specific DNA-methyltransferase [Acidimicrobiia bacterium]